MKTMRIVFLCTLFVAKNSFAQVSEDGIPPSFLNNTLRQTVAMETMARVNVDSLIKAEEAEKERDGGRRPFQFGYAMKVNLNLENSGTWEELENGDKIWRLKIHSEDAYSINLIFDRFWLPEGARFFVYGEDRRMVLGAFTAKTSNNERNVFATDLIQGNTIVLEYYEPAYTNGGIISIDKVIHAYKDMFGENNRNDPCELIDIMCPQGDNWCVEKRAVAMILGNDNTSFCTGCLVNNVRGDFKPYLLTAYHCYFDNEEQTSDPATNIFRFHNWKLSCNGANPTHNYTIEGATLRAYYKETDFALLELSKKIDNTPVTYAGWDRSSSPPTSSTMIHHAFGERMKISLAYGQAVSSSWFASNSNTHWKVTINEGHLGGKASGAPLFNQNRKIVGQNTGGATACPPKENMCGRFDKSWEGGGTSSTRLKDWLDPDNADALSVNAVSDYYWTYLFNKTLTGTHKYSAIHHMHIEGNVQTKTSVPCPTSEIPFTTEPGSNVTFKAKSITIGPGTIFKSGSTVSLIATNTIDCDGFTDGDFHFCPISRTGENSMLTSKYLCSGDSIANSSHRKNNNVNFEKDSKKDVRKTLTIHPNPNTGTFTIATNIDPEEIISVQVFSMIGQSIYKQSGLPNSTIQMPSSTSGMFYVEILTKTEKFVRKMVVY